MTSTDLWALNDRGQLDVHLHAGQARAWQSQARFVTVCAGTQSGKTSFGPLWAYREIQLRGPGDGIIATPTFPLLNLKLLPEFKRLFEDRLRLGKYTGSPTKAFTFSEEGARRTFGYAPDVPTQIFFGHAQDPDSLESATAKWAWLDEAGQKKFKRGSFEAILRRLSIHQGRVLTTTTPYSAFGWLKSELHDRAAAGDSDYDWIRFESRMNPAFPSAEWERAKRSLPRWKFDLMYRGMLTRPAGMIYDCFDELEHVTPAFTIPANWRRFVGLDFGGVNTAATFWAEEPVPHDAPSDQLPTYWVYREYLQGERTAKEHAQALLTGEPGVPTTVGGAKSEDQWRKEFRAGGLPVREPPVSEVEVGIQRLYGLLKAGRVKIFDTCKGLIEDISTYSRELDDNDQPTEAIEDKSTYHLGDSARYIAAYLNADEPSRIEPIGLAD